MTHVNSSDTTPSSGPSDAPADQRPSAEEDSETYTPEVREQRSAQSAPGSGATPPNAPQYQAPPPNAPQYQAPPPNAPQYQAPPPNAPQYQTPQYRAPQTPLAAPPRAQVAQPRYAGAPPQPYPLAPPTNTLAIISLVSSIAGIFMFFIPSVVGVILGHIGLSQIKQRGEGGRGLAIAGLVIGYVGVGLGLLSVLFYSVLFFGSFATVASFD